MNTLWWMVLWFYMGGMILGFYWSGGITHGAYALISVLIIFWWFRAIGFFGKA